MRDEVKLLPSTSSLEDRDRASEERRLSSLGPCVVRAREIMHEELIARFFGERPSNARLVQIHMSKQKRLTTWMPEDWQTLAETIYLRWLRKACEHLSSSTRKMRSSPNKKAKTSKSTALVLFDNDDESDGRAEDEQDDDEVTIEVERWKSISSDTLAPFKDANTGMINEFAFMWAQRKNFPIHYFVFKQTASHLPHEGNVEQIFSLGGRLSDPNMNPAYLATLVCNSA